MSYIDEPSGESNVCVLPPLWVNYHSHPQKHWAARILWEAGYPRLGVIVGGVQMSDTHLKLCHLL